MTITIDEETGRTRITADEGKAVHRIGTPSPCSVIGVLLRVDDTPTSWEDCEFGEPEHEEKTMKYSTLSIKRELAALGRWDAAKALMQSSSVWDDYILANYLAETDPVFVAAKTAFVEAGIVTAEELAEMLPKCVWTAE